MGKFQWKKSCLIRPTCSSDARHDNKPGKLKVSL